MAWESRFRADEAIWSVPKLTKQLRETIGFDRSVTQFVDIEPVIPQGVGINTTNYIRLESFQEADPTTAVGVGEGAIGPGYTAQFAKQSVSLTMTAFYWTIDEETIRRADFNTQQRMVFQARRMLDELDSKRLIYLAKQTYMKVIPDVAGSTRVTWDTDGTLSTTAASAFDLDDLDDLHTDLSDTYRYPTHTEGAAAHYTILAGRHFFENITSDAVYREIYRYNKPELLWYGELGATAGFRLVHTNLVTSKTGTQYAYKLRWAVGTNNIPEALVFGKDAFRRFIGWAEEFRGGWADPPFNLQYALVVRKLDAFAIPWDYTSNTAGQVRIAHITSA